MEGLQALFQQSYVDPALQQLKQSILPAIKESFAGEEAGASSALNQALGEAAKDVTTQLGGKFGDFFQNQQTNQLSALSQLGNLAGTRTFEPTTLSKEGWLPGLLQGLGSLFGGIL